MNDWKTSGPWSRAEIERYLLDTRIPARLSVLTADGAPIVVSHWFIFEDGRLHCAARDSAAVVACLRRDPRCGFEIAADQPPYRGLRGRGRAGLAVDRDRALLARLHDRYLGPTETGFRRWLLGAEEPEIAIAIESDTMMSWDYGRRMAG